jgi:hypothetical protein
MSNVKVGKPCTEDWNKMTPEDKGKFCSKCAKVVQDFRQSSREEISRFMTSSTGSSCGRFYKHQLADIKQQPHWRFFRRFAFAVLLAFGSTLFTVNTALAQDKIDAWKTAFQIEKNGVKEQCDYVIEGTVIDEHTKEPVGFAKVTYIKKDNEVVEAIANEKGKFKIELDEKDIIDLKKVALSAYTDTGGWYYGHSELIDLTKSFPADIEIKMYYEEVMGIMVDPDWEDENK